MTLRFETAGMLTTVQDLGRVGYARLGINRSGVMDVTAARILNCLLGNDENAALVEMHFPAPKIIFERSGVFAVGGADFAPAVNGEPIRNWRPFPVAAGDRLTFEDKVLGSRASLAVRGGFAGTKWLGSASTALIPGLGSRIGPGETIDYNDGIPKKLVSGTAASSMIPHYSRFPTVRIIAGAEFDLLSDDAKKQLVDQDHVITSRSDRMGFRLAGEPLAVASSYEFISSAVAFGTIQLLPNGQLIVLMADHQTTGGYPRLAHVITRDLPLIAQLGPNDKVAFHLVTLSEAEALADEFERELRIFRAGCRLLWNASG